MENIKLLNKKGEMTSKQLITLVILIISFGIILFFWSMFNWQGDINRETCHTSVVLRASATFKGWEFMDNIPLKCQTDRICFKNGLFSKGCDIYGANVRNVKVANKEELLDFITEDIYNWHQTLGEGKVNFFETTWIIHDKHCLIDSVYSFDNQTREVIEKEGGLTFGEVYQKLESKQNSDGVSYFKAMYGTDLNNYLNKLKSDNPQLIVLNKKINLSNNYALIGGVIPGTNKIATFTAIGVGVTGGVLLAIVLWPVAVPAAVGSAATAATVSTTAVVVGATATTVTASSVAASSGVILTTTGATAATAGTLSTIGAIASAIGTATGIASATTVSATAASAASGVLFFTLKDDPTTNMAYIPPALIEYNLDSLNGLKCDAFETLA